MLRISPKVSERPNDQLNSLAAVDLFHITPEEGKKLGDELIRLNKYYGVNYIPRGLSRYRHDDLVEETYIKTEDSLIIRPREHHRDEFRVEVFLKELGSGGSGTVYSTATFAFKDNNELYFKRKDRVVKVFKKNTDINYVQNEHLISSAIFGRSSKKPFVLAQTKERFIARVEKKLTGYDLYDFIFVKGNNKNPDRLLQLSKSILLNLIEIHHKGILHRDIKLDNLMADKASSQTGIIDFGSAIYANVPPLGAVGTDLYFAPEIWDSRTYSQASDIFALGIVLGYLWGAQALPGHGPGDFEEATLKKFSRNVKFVDLFGSIINLSDDEKDILSDIFHSMVACEPSKRIALVDALIQIEKLILERKINTYSQAERAGFEKAYADALKARAAFTELGQQKVRNTYANEQAMRNIEEKVITIIEHYLTDDKYVELFVDVTGIQLFNDLHTVQAVKAACSHEFGCYAEKMNCWKKFQDFSGSISDLIKLHKLYNKFSEEFNRIIEPFSDCFDRDEQPLTLDYLAAFNRKYLRDYQMVMSKLATLQIRIQAIIHKSQNIGLHTALSLFKTSKVDSQLIDVRFVCKPM